MINLIHRCMTKSELSHKKWDNHLALFHLKEFVKAKEVYLNGKPLKWYHIFKKGDLIEVIDRPQGLFTLIGAAIFGSILFGASTTTFTVLGALVVTGIVGAVAAIGTSIMGGMRGFSTPSTTQNKEYSSVSQPELRGASNDISNDIIPVTFGTVQQTPSYAQTPFRLVQDGTGKNKYHQYFIANYDNVVYSDYKLGETPITNYEATYYDINTAYGSSTFIGYDNCKALSIDEELSYDKDAQIYDGNWTSESTNARNNTKATSETVYLSIYFDADNTANFDTSKFSSKTFKVTLKGNGTTQTRNFTISSVGYVSAEGHLYPTGNNPSVSFSITFPVRDLFIYSYTITVQSVSDTRQNSYEVLHGLTATLETVSITIADYSHNFNNINQSITKYNIVPSEIIQTSPPNTTDIDVIISFPQGLYKIKSSDGNRLSRSAALEIKYKEISENNWHDLNEATSIYIRDIDNVKQPLSSSSTTYSNGIITVHSPDDINIADQLFFRPIGFELPAGQYNVRVRCADFKDKTNYDVGVPNCSEIQFRCTGDVVNPIVLPKTTQLAFEVTAYKNLSGTLKKFNYITKTYIPRWNISQWDWVTVTSNPAAVIRYLLTDSKVNPRAEDLSHIDNDSLVEYFNWCEEQGYKADGVISEACKIGEVVNEILKNTQCAMIPLYNGKHTFVIDKPNKIPVGLFNQHNSWNFKWTPNVGRQTEAIRASFVEDDDWTQDELTLYWYDGAVHDTPKSGTSDLDYEMVKKEYKYVSDRASVRKIVAYELETIQTKRNQFEFDVNLEAMNMMLLDRVYISNTANMQNESTGLIKSLIIEGGYLKGFELYSPVNIPENAKIIIRSLNYLDEKTIITIYDVTNSGESNIVNIPPVWRTESVNALSIKGAGEITGLQDTWYYDGDLFTIGQDTIYDCTVTDIKYNDDGTATITARDYGFGVNEGA